MTLISRRRILLWAIVVLLSASGARAIEAGPEPVVRTIRVPDGGVQPQVAVDDRAVVHMIYLIGAAGHSDVSYLRSTDGGSSFSRPLRVNSQEGSAIAIGTVRGAHLAVAKGGRVHVAWMGSDRAEPKAESKAAPMLYSRLNDSRDAFEPQRNIIQSHPGLDGGGSVAADQRGNVFVAWHAPEKKDGTERDRRVWLARSTDGGKTFAPEVVASPSLIGACGCCGMRLISDGSGNAIALFRSAEEGVNRDMYLVRSNGDSESFRTIKIHPMKSEVCVMSTAALTQGSGRILAAWETDQQIYLAMVAPQTLKMTTPVAMPGQSSRRKHPAIAVNAAGQVLVVWAEGTGWSKGGSLAWQVFEKDGQAIETAAGHADGLPVWGSPAAFARTDGAFVIVY